MQQAFAAGWAAATLFLAVQKPDTEIEVCGEGKPNQIGNLQLCRQGIDFAPCEDHTQNQCPQKQQPQKGKAVGLRVKKDRRPEKIYDQLPDKEIDAPAALF